MSNQLVDLLRIFVKHLAGRHDQKRHGRITVSGYKIFDRTEKPSVAKYGRNVREYIDDGYVSTSMNIDVAEAFGSGPDYENLFYENVIQLIKVPKGSNALLKVGHEHSEAEMVLSRGGRFIIEKEWQSAKGQRYQLCSFHPRS